jgi:urease accessory protein
MSIDWLRLVLQTSDPLFPTGSYAHSFGFEEFARLSGVSDEGGLRRFLDLQILPALTYQELPYLRFAHGCSAANDLPGLVTLDREVNAWKIPFELRAASLRLGTRRLDILLKTIPNPLLAALSKQIAAGVMPGHHITISGAQYGAIPLEAALMTYLYQTLSSYCVAALKFIRIGQEACQRVLAACLERAPSVLRDSLEIERPQAGCFNPLLEIASMRHETAFERLFIS